MNPVLASGALLLAAASPARLSFADGAWASFDRGTACEAATRAQRIASDRSTQAHAAFAFDRSGPRHGQFAARLGKPVAPGATVIMTIDRQPFLLVSRDGFAWSKGPVQESAIIAAVRTGQYLRLEARSATGGRFIDTYALDGAPGAIDAAAACAGHPR